MLGSTGPRALSIIIVDLQGPSENDPHAVKGRILPSPSPLPTCDTKIGPCTKIWTSNMAKAHQMLVAKALRQFGAYCCDSIFPHTCFPLVQSFGALNLLNTLARCRLIYIEVFSIAPAAWCLFDTHPSGGKNNNRRMKSSKLSLHLTKSANGSSWNTWKSPGIGCSDLPFSQPLSTRHWFVHFEGRPALPGESVKRCHLHPARYAPSNSMPHSHPAAVFSKAVPNAALKRITMAVWRDLSQGSAQISGSEVPRHRCFRPLALFWPLVASWDHEPRNGTMLQDSQSSSTVSPQYVFGVAQFLNAVRGETHFWASRPAREKWWLRKVDPEDAEHVKIKRASFLHRHTAGVAAPALSSQHNSVRRFLNKAPWQFWHVASV